MKDLATLHGPNVRWLEGQQGDGSAIGRDKLDLVGDIAFVAVNNGTNVASLKIVLVRVRSEDNRVKFVQFETPYFRALIEGTP